ncbi:Bacterial TniB protein [compost metagenome]
MSAADFSGRRSNEVLQVGQQVLDTVVDHAVFRQIRDACLNLVETMRSLRMPGGILIQADPGMGKTLLLELVRRALVSRGAESGEYGCLRLALDSAVDTLGIAAASMLALGYPAVPSRPNLATMNHLVNTGLERRRPWGMLIDEMQHVCEGNKDITARSVTDWLKVRMDAHNFPVICAGTRALERLTIVNPQFTNRASANFVIHPFQFDDSWRQLLAGFASAVKSVDLSVVNSAACRPLHLATGGNMRSLKTVLTYACMHTMTQANRIVTMESLARGFVDARGQVGAQNNPFRTQGRGGT